MSVIVRGVGESHFTVFCKGSPEKIKSISLPETLPVDFDETLDRSAFFAREPHPVPGKSVDCKTSELQIIWLCNLNNSFSNFSSRSRCLLQEECFAV
jgi:hypothetical protein